LDSRGLVPEYEQINEQNATENTTFSIVERNKTNTKVYTVTFKNFNTSSNTIQFPFSAQTLLVGRHRDNPSRSSWKMAIKMDREGEGDSNTTQLHKYKWHLLMDTQHCLSSEQNRSNVHVQASQSSR